MDASELDALLDQLRTIQTDHQAVEAKRARRSLPSSTHETLSAFANTGGGTLLLGVDERGGSFDVTGVESPQQAQSDLQALCAQMDPPLRAIIELVDHPGGPVVLARVPAVPRHQRPCHLASLRAEESSFVRVGDGDQHLTTDEVRYMLAGSATTDYSCGPVADDAELDSAAVAAWLAIVRAASHRNDELDERMLSRRWRLVGDDDRPTLAGLLTLGAHPQASCAAARITYRILPRTTDPPGTRHAGRHAEGTVGELLDDVLAWLRADLGQVQVVRDGGVFDVPPIPVEAIREVLSNALVHRSFAPGLRDRAVVVEISDDAVAVTSPGNLYAATDPELLGLSPMSGVRNTALVRIGEHLSTPSGARVVENQTTGIAAADQAAHRAGVMPPLFIDRPDSFQVLLPRGLVDTRVVRNPLVTFAVPRVEDAVRLLAVARRLEELQQWFPGLAGIAFDSALAARALAPCSIEEASVRLAELEEAGLLRRLTVRHRPAWTTVPHPRGGVSTGVAGTAASGRRGGGDRLPDLLAAIAAADDGVLSAGQIGRALGLASPNSRNRWISRAKEKGLIEPTKDNPFDPTGAYRLTSAGRHVLERSR